MSLANLKATTEYQEAIQATEDIEPPAVGLEKTTYYKGGLTNQVNAIIKQNNTLLYLASKQSQKLIELEEKFDRLKQKVHTIIEKEIQPADLVDSISSLAKRLDNFSISGTQLVYTFPDMILSVNDFHNHVEVAIQTHGYDTWQGGESNLLITMALTGRLSNTSYMGFQYSVENVVDHLTTNGITTILGERRSIDELEGMSWNLKPPEQMSVREKWSTLGEPSGKWDYYVRYDAPINTTLIEEIAATGWGEEFSNDEVTPERPGSAGKTSITLDSVHAGGRVHSPILRRPSTCFLNDSSIAGVTCFNGRSSIIISGLMISSLQTSPFFFQCFRGSSRYDAPINTTPIEEIAATGWGEEFSDDEVTLRKLTILNEAEEESDWDNDERKLEWENPFAAKRGEDHTILHLSKEEENNNDLPYPMFRNFKKVAAQIIKQHEEHVFPSTSQEESTQSYQPPHDSIIGPSVYPPTQQNPQPFYRPDYQFGYPQRKGKTFSGGYGEYYNSQWTLPPAWTESRVMLVLPADPCLWSEVITRWESITINRLNNQTWSDNKVKLAFVENLLGESEKLMWQQWRTMFLEAYSALEAIADEPQNITSQVRQINLLEDPYRGSTDEQDRAYRDLDRITYEETKNLWSFLEDFRQLATKLGRLYFPSTTEKLFAKLPPSLSKKIDESFRAKYPGLNSGVLPAIKFTHTFVSKMCKDAALAKELRDLSLCSAIPIPGYYKNNRKKYGMRKSRTYKGKPHNSHVKPFKRKYKDDRGRVKKCKCFICRKEGHFAKDCRSKKGNIAISAVYQELDLDDNWDIVSADFDDSSVYIISEGEGVTHQNISVMVQNTPVEEIAFMAIEEDDESDSDQEEEDALKTIDQLRIEKERLEEQKDEEIKKLKAQLQKRKEEVEV
uniref:TPA: orf y n=1 Tax=Tanacetum cinerariifolium TaxID=118510 RepID=A0A699HXU9_TANCI|nr:TPA: orf y [Tanacetum cinerariifolium]